MRNFRMLLASTFLLATILGAFFLVGVTYSGQPYDAWCDLDDDGDIDIFDIVTMAGRYGMSGTPINKTELLLELQAKVDELESNIAVIRTRIEALNASVQTHDADIAALYTDLATLQTELGAFETDIAELNASVVDLQSKLETRAPKKCVITVPSEAFNPYGDVSYTKSPGRIYGAYVFYAALQLPNGSVVTNMTAKLWDSDSSNQVILVLKKCYNSEIGSCTYMANIMTTFPEAPGAVVRYDDTIYQPTIDNENFSYVLEVDMSTSSALQLNWVQIEYEFQT